ncbi:MAG: NAD-binding protein [Flavobacteriales bacterium]
MRKYAVIGVGKYGSQIARKLAENGAEVYAFDLSEEKIERIKDEVAFAVALDSTDKKALISQDIEKIDAAVVAIGENFEAVVLTSVHLLELKIERVIARAHGPMQKQILKKIGVQELLTPEDEVAELVTERLLNPSIISSLPLPDDCEIAEIKVPEGIANRTIEDLDMKKRYRLNLIALKRQIEVKEQGEKTIEQHLVDAENIKTVIYETDSLVVFGTKRDIERFIEVND